MSGDLCPDCGALSFLFGFSVFSTDVFFFLSALDFSVYILLPSFLRVSSLSWNRAGGM